MARQWREQHLSTFAENAWQPGEWLPVTRPDWGHRGSWRQLPAAIENQVPADATPAQLLRERVQETFAGMVLAEPVEGDFQFAATMEFADRMAPSLLLVAELGPDDNGYRPCQQHLEAVLFDQGLNLWSHQRDGDRSTWTKRAWWRFVLHPGTPYRLELERRGSQLTCRVEGHECGCHLGDLPSRLHLGLAGQEGVNRFYRCSLRLPA